jgi:dTDP-4-dehydrorhamnose 3,5-epimerase
MELRETTIAGVVEITTKRFGDDRGWFRETHKKPVLDKLGLEFDFVQDNESMSNAVGTVRGIHFQKAPFAQGKLVRVVRGAVQDVAIDLRVDSPTYKQHVSVELNGEDGNQLWIPVGFGHCFVTLEPNTIVSYKVTAPYDYDSEVGVKFDDPDLAVPWQLPSTGAMLSAKDEVAPSLAELEATGQLF